MLKTFVQTPANWVLLYGGRAVSRVQRLLGAEDEGRKLTTDEKILLEKIYAGAVDLDSVRLKTGDIGVFALGGAPFTHGNTIYVPGGWLPPADDSFYEETFRALLVHEVMHVWQYQNGGANYMTESLAHQLAGWFGEGSRGAAYNFAGGVRRGKIWSELNPEQQAKLIERCYVAGFFDADEARFISDGEDYTEYAREAVRQMRNGEGAP